MKSPIVRWGLMMIACLAITALVAYARGEPGVDGRVADNEDIVPPSATAHP